MSPAHVTPLEGTQALSLVCVLTENRQECQALATPENGKAG